MWNTSAARLRISVHSSGPGIAQRLYFPAASVCPPTTTIALSRAMVVGGQTLAAGKYSLWANPGPDEWTLILSRAADVFHIPYPGAAQDALRLTVKPQAGPFMESLAFYFPAAAADRALLNLHWGETIVQVSLAVK